MRQLALELLRDAASVPADLADCDQRLMDGQLADLEQRMSRLADQLDQRLLSECDVNDILRLALEVQQIHNDLAAFWATQPLTTRGTAPHEVTHGR